MDNWRTVFDTLSKEIMPTCGLCYELYQRRLSDAIDSKLYNIDDEEKKAAIAIAREEFDYRSPEEIINDIEHDKENDICSHGFHIDCCPLGCGSI